EAYLGRSNGPQRSPDNKQDQGGGYGPKSNCRGQPHYLVHIDGPSELWPNATEMAHQRSTRPRLIHPAPLRVPATGDLKQSGRRISRFDDGLCELDYALSALGGRLDPLRRAVEETQAERMNTSVL